MKPRDAYWVAESKAWEQMSWNKTRSILESEFKNCEDVDIRLFAEVLPNTATISREMFAKAWVEGAEAYNANGGSSSFYDEVLNRLFGPSEKKQR